MFVPSEFKNNLTASTVWNSEETGDIAKHVQMIFHLKLQVNFETMLNKFLNYDFSIFSVLNVPTKLEPPQVPVQMDLECAVHVSSRVVLATTSKDYKKWWPDF